MRRGWAPNFAMLLSLDSTGQTLGATVSHMLRKAPGAFIMLGNGIGPGLHNPGYNFNDDAIPLGVSYWARLAETAMPA